MTSNREQVRTNRRFMRGIRFLRAVLNLSCERELEPLMCTAVQLAARAVRASSAWLELPRAAGVLRRLHGEKDDRAIIQETTICIDGRDGLFGVSRVEPFTAQERERLELLARQLALVATGIVRDEPGVPLPDEMYDLRRRRIARALKRHQGNVAAAARELGVARSHVHKVRRSLRR